MNFKKLIIILILLFDNYFLMNTLGDTNFHNDQPHYVPQYLNCLYEIITNSINCGDLGPYLDSPTMYSEPKDRGGLYEFETAKEIPVDGAGVSFWYKNIKGNYIAIQTAFGMIHADTSVPHNAWRIIAHGELECQSTASNCPYTHTPF
jgi:hypothetical protein